MADASDVIEWDFVTVVAWWNLFGLPVLLLAVAIFLLVRRQSRSAPTAWPDRSRTVGRIGLIHCALALQSFNSLVQALLTMRTMGIPESHIRLVGVSIGTVVNPLLGIGLLRRRIVARWFAIAWYAILSLIAVVVMAWLWHYGVSFDPAAWPEQMISKVMPFFLFVVMLLPQTKRAFAKQGQAEPRFPQPSSQGGSFPLPEASADRPVVALLTLVFLIVVCSNLVVDAADWGYRLAAETASIP
jgi:Ca2+/Na+ antiporter